MQRTVRAAAQAVVEGLNNPTVNWMGLEATLELERWGWYAIGQGVMHATIRGVQGREHLVGVNARVSSGRRDTASCPMPDGKVCTAVADKVAMPVTSHRRL